MIGCNFCIIIKNTVITKPVKHKFILTLYAVQLFIGCYFDSVDLYVQTNLEVGLKKCFKKLK